MSGWMTFAGNPSQGKSPPEDFAVISEGIRARIAELDAKASEVGAPPAVGTLFATRPGERNAPATRRLDILVRWEEMSLAAQRSVISAVSAPVLLGGRGTDPERIVMNFRRHDGTRPRPERATR